MVKGRHEENHTVYSQFITKGIFLAPQVARTERIKNCLNPKFAKTFLIDYHFEIVQKLRFAIYDIDNKTIDLSDDDFLGEMECSLGQVRRSAFC